MKTLIVATGNAGKLTEIKAILADVDVRVITMTEAGLHPEIIENGETFRDNALIKVRTVYQDYLRQRSRGLDLPAPEDVFFLADDSGLEVDALGGAPGVYSARFMGEKTPYTIKCNAIVQKLEGLQGEERKADFRCVMAAVFPGGREWVTEGIMEGQIGFGMAGSGGFGYDPIFYLPDVGKTSAEISAEEKNERSHRGKALRAMAKELVNRI